MEWISVEDRLPDFYYDVLICYEKNRVSVGHFYIDTNRWYSRTQEVIVTHWMPFPEPPK